MLASVTRLRVRSMMHLPPFAWETFLIQRQALRAPGFLGGSLLVDAHRTFWTLTVWESEQSMKGFRGTAPHAKVMPHLVEWCDEASYAHWIIPTGASVPSWPEAYEHLVAEGRLSRVAHPSPAPDARQFAAPRLRPQIAANLKPRKRASIRDLPA
jgi:hypothetical protein